MTTNPTPSERVRQAQAMLLPLAGDPKAFDFIPVVTMSDDEMGTFINQLANLVTMLVKTSEVTVRVIKARQAVQAAEVSRLERLTNLAKQ